MLRNVARLAVGAELVTVVVLWCIIGEHLCIGQQQQQQHPGSDSDEELMNELDQLLSATTRGNVKVTRPLGLS